MGMPLVSQKALRCVTLLCASLFIFFFIFFKKFLVRVCVRVYAHGMYLPACALYPCTSSL